MKSEKRLDSKIFKSDKQYVNILWNKDKGISVHVDGEIFEVGSMSETIKFFDSYPDREEILFFLDSNGMTVFDIFGEEILDKPIEGETTELIDLFNELIETKKENFLF